MKAVLYKAPGRVEVAEVPKPKIEQPTDAIVRVTTASICGSDLHIYHGQLSTLEDLIVGHEFVGVVDALGGGVGDFAVGDRVFVEGGVSCGACAACKNRLSFCLHGGIFGTSSVLGTLQGGQAEFVRVPFAQRVMHKVPDHLSDEDVILLTDVLITGYTAADWGGIRPGDTVVVYGCGPVGLCAQISARLFNPARVFAVDMVDYRLEVAERLGCIPVNGASEDAPMRIRMETGLLGADVAIEAVGAKGALEAAFRSVRFGGTLSVVGVFTEDATIPLSELHILNVTIRMGLADPAYVPRLLRLVESGALDLKPLFTHTMPLAEAARAYEMFDRKEDKVIKILLKP